MECTPADQCGTCSCHCVSDSCMGYNAAASFADQLIATGVSRLFLIVPILNPLCRHVSFQDAFAASLAGTGKLVDPATTGAIVCGHGDMCKAITAMLTEAGVSKEKVLMNY